MLSFIRHLFFLVCEQLNLKCKKRKNDSDHSIKIKKENKVIIYNSELIRVLEKDHQVLLSLHAYLMKCAINKEYESLVRAMNDFSSILATHLRKESIDLYMYLEFIVVKADETDTRETFRSFRLEMKKISIQVSSILHHYENTPVTDQTVEKFLIDFKELGEILVDRIKREEKILYPIYINLKKEEDGQLKKEPSISQLPV
ncbi:MAG: hemerythrin domain-containing protein [Cocleimonas sp.]|nr:hemerythrin domain-containing protein [Cocleimonas sp.]